VCETKHSVTTRDCIAVENTAPNDTDQNTFQPNIERGFYDVTMLTSCFLDTCEFLHPDSKLEYVLHDYHKQRMIADQIVPLQGDHTGQISELDVTRREPDISDSGPAGTHSELDITDSGPDIIESSCVVSVACATTDHCAMLLDCDIKKTKLCASLCPVVRPDDFWIKEQSFSQVEDIGSNITQFKNQEISKHDEIEFEMDKRMRPLSVYELEDISVEPGMVQRTKLEIERRERLVFCCLCCNTLYLYSYCSSIWVHIFRTNTGRQRTPV